jgi:hypothetical protein
MASRGRGTGSQALGLGPMVVVHLSGARHNVRVGWNGVGRHSGEWLGRKLVGVGGKGV